MIISLAQLSFSNANIEQNFNKIIQNLDNFLDSDIIIFPELFLTGYLPLDLILRKEYKNIISFKIKELNQVIKQKKLSDKIFIIGSPFYQKDNIYNSAIILYKNKIYNYNKIFLPNYGVFDEKRYFKSGDKFIILKTKYNDNDLNKSLNLNLSILICEDIWVDFSPAYYLKSKYDISLFIVINSSPFEIRKIYLRQQIVRNIAKNCNSFVIYVNNLGLFDDILFDGSSFICDNYGNIIYTLSSFKEEISHFNFYKYLLDKNNKIIDKNKENSYKISKTSLKKILKNKVYSYFEFYKNFKLQELEVKFFKKNNIFKKNVLENDNYKTNINDNYKSNNLESNNLNLNGFNEQDYKLIYEGLLFGIREYFLNSGFKQAIIGLSGGIDSALCLVLAKFSISNVIPIIMPTKFNKKSSIDDAIKLCKNLNLDYFIIDINDFYFFLRNNLIERFSLNDSFDISDENLQSRLRALILMYYANKTNSLVIATSNKSEVSIGYFTLYGDSVGSIAPLKDLYKFQVYELANYVNKIHNNVIPQEIISKPPSAELRENQKDEDDIPKYYILDKVLYLHLEKNLDYKEIKGILKQQGIDLKKEVYLDIVKRIYSNEYKRYQSPIGFKLSPLSFTKERRVPIINSFFYDIKRTLDF